MIEKKQALVRVYVIYRRPHLLRRALQSLVAQTLKEWKCVVINDDPMDLSVDDVVEEIADARITLYEPLVKRGATRNFNLAFSVVGEPFAAILEDDNWWRADYLETMVQVLVDHPDIVLANSNERIWKEMPNGDFKDTGRMVWPISKEEGVIQFQYGLIDKCGKAVLCNSAMVFRTARADSMKVPDTIPVDVTEHFRERVVPHPIALVTEPLVNWSETIKSYRSKDNHIWSLYQMLLVGSVFELASDDAERTEVAKALWSRCRAGDPFLVITLMYCAAFIPAAGVLKKYSRWREIARFLVHALRRPGHVYTLSRALVTHKSDWLWLLAARRQCMADEKR